MRSTFYQLLLIGCCWNTANVALVERKENCIEPVYSPGYFKHEYIENINETSTIDIGCSNDCCIYLQYEYSPANLAIVSSPSCTNDTDRQVWDRFFDISIQQDTWQLNDTSVIVYFDLGESYLVMEKFEHFSSGKLKEILYVVKDRDLEVDFKNFHVTINKIVPTAVPKFISEELNLTLCQEKVEPDFYKNTEDTHMDKEQTGDTYNCSRNNSDAFLLMLIFLIINTVLNL